MISYYLQRGHSLESLLSLSSLDKRFYFAAMELHQDQMKNALQF